MQHNQNDQASPRIIVETERLLIRQFSRNDAPFINRLLNTPGWLQFIGDRGVRTNGDAEAYLISKIIPPYTTFGFGFYAVVLKEGLVPIGMSGFIRRDYLDNPDFGYAYLPEHGKKGYAIEAANALLAHAKDTLRIPTLHAIVTPGNDASVALLHKLAFAYTKTINANGEPLLLFTKAVTASSEQTSNTQLQ